MSLNPLNELKRRLSDTETPLPKRLCLAKNIVHSHNFPTAPKERAVAEWLQTLSEQNAIGSKELRNFVKWLDGDEDLTGELKGQLIQVVYNYLKNNPLQEGNVQCIISFLEHPRIFSQLCLQIDNFLYIVTTILQYLRTELKFALSEKILNSLITYYKECKKKLEFITKLLEGEHIKTLFNYLDTENHTTVISVCQNIIFPINKKSFFISFLQTLIRKDNIEELIAEKGDNIQSVLKIMDTFFGFLMGTRENDPKFLSDFVNVFVSCFKGESQMIFAFYIIVISSLNMEQNYLKPVMKMPTISFINDEKIKRNLFLNILMTLVSNEIDINVRLTDTFGEKISKVEIKKNFTFFLQNVMMGQLKLEGKLDKTTLEIIKVSLILDPILIEQKLNEILPSIMTAKKTNSNTIKSYTDMINCLLATLFKLSRGISFINQILSNLKLSLEASNTEQLELKQKVKECIENGMDIEKLQSKIISASDIFPEECLETYGKWTSELMFRQNKELLTLLQKDLEEHCLITLERGLLSPSVVTLTEFLSAILSSFLRHSKMADHTVPKQIAEDFWQAFHEFEDHCLKKFGECVSKFNYDPQLTMAFLKLSLSVANLKLLNWKYSNTKLDIPAEYTKEVFDMSIILPCLKCKQWIALASNITDDGGVLLLNKLLLAKTMALTLFSIANSEEIDAIFIMKAHLIKQVATQSNVLEIPGFPNVIFSNLDKHQVKQLSKQLVKLCLNNSCLEMFKIDAIVNNKMLINALVLETCKTLAKCFENDNLSKAMNKSNFDITTFVNDINIREYFEQISLNENENDTINNCINILKDLPLSYVDENYQLVGIFVVLLLKKCCQKKMRKCIDHLLLKIYELSPKYPDVFKIFPIDFLFCFDGKLMINLLTLKIKNANHMLVIKCILESAVKKVKTDSEIVKNLVQILLTKQRRKFSTSSIEYFSDTAFQISCIILPIIAKEKRAITTSAYRSILANLQEKLHKSMLDAFKNIDFSNNSSLLNETNGNTDESMVVSENTLATLNAIGAYALTLSKYCETNDANEIQNLDCLWSGLEFFVQYAIQSLENASSKPHHIDASTHLLTVILRHMKKLESHPLFATKDDLFKQVWKGLLQRLLIEGPRNEDVAVMLKYLSEFCSVECFSNTFVADLNALMELKNPTETTQETVSSHKVSKYMLTQILKANIVGPKCVNLSKLMSRHFKQLRVWLQEYFVQDVRNDGQGIRKEMDTAVCDLIRTDLDVLAEVILAAKKITLDYKLLDSIFQLLHLLDDLLHTAANFTLFEGSLNVLNSLLQGREELLEDRWPCYMQCYRILVRRLCEMTSQVHNASEANKMADLAHCLEKLTQSICKRKAHISRIASYTVADTCSLLERTGPSKIVRQHLENSTALLIQASDSSYSAAFLRRALAGNPGHTTLGNMYTMYKRYHKYVGNA